MELNSKIVWGNYHIPGSTFRISNELAFQHTDVLLLCPRIGLLQSKPSSVLSKKHFSFDIILLVRSCLLISGAVWYVAMIATAFNRYQDLNLVCNDAHFARYLLLEAAIASFGFIACLLLKVAFTSSGFAAFLRLTAALAGLVALWFVAYLNFDPTLFGLGLAAYLALEIALCSALLLVASLLPVEAIQAVCSLAETSFFFVRYHSNRFSLARVALNGILVYTAKFRTFT